MLHFTLGPILFPTVAFEERGGQIDNNILATTQRSLSTMINLTLIPLLFFAVAAQGGDEPAAGEAKSAACIGCHGVKGNSENPLWPKLAQQHPSYFVKQIGDFKSGARKHDIMTAMAQNISEGDAEAIAVYFAAQQRTGGAADPEKKVLGEKIYYMGNDVSGAVACFPCHGGEGLGSDPKVFPNIAGQHAAYIEKILKDFRSGLRTNDRENLMQNTVVQLNDEEITAVAQYVQGLPYPREAEGPGSVWEWPCRYPHCPPFEHEMVTPHSGTGSSAGGQRRERSGQQWQKGR